MQQKTDEYVDFYEALEVSPNASAETVERVFRYLAKQNHPDFSENADVKKFARLVEAYETLRDPKLRADYDKVYEKQAEEKVQLVEDAGNADKDVAERHHLLSLFYARRRRNMKEPGIGASTLESVLNSPPEVVEFHIWYFRQRNWIMREENGSLSITAEGVDQIELMIAKQNEKTSRFITQEDRRVEEKTSPKEPCGAK